MLTAATALKIAFELTLSLGIKLFIENGRIHPADFVNDFLFWVPGVEVHDDDGIARQAHALLGPVAPVEALPQAPAPTPTPLPAAA